MLLWKPRAAEDVDLSSLKYIGHRNQYILWRLLVIIIQCICLWFVFPSFCVVTVLNQVRSFKFVNEQPVYVY